MQMSALRHAVGCVKVPKLRREKPLCRCVEVEKAVLLGMREPAGEGACKRRLEQV